MDTPESLTDLIRLAREGDSNALSRVFDATYPELRRLARTRLTPHARGLLLDTTSLVHESYLRFIHTGALKLNDRQHFMRYAANVMRSVVVDFVRERQAERRGGDAQQVTLDTHVADTAAAGEEEILKVHEALEELATYDERMARIVEMRYFAGMTENEIAEAFGVTDRTVRRDWEKARLLLAKALSR
ncbi:RNA polymerase sigma factor (TIGR02999 family) [Povalibacter uvarum]|uniref:RNA polymerase sigma factor (TIGR02999 family) n=1 Tax=Povalibacter uvarum TaxID=732238 RepID=A0A841HM78_9GAMM|nr:ECF-type sigma factor [Povalibacter uvarum]MBB6093976.1 RNA polymerase sigma factor (TIGR02999 family) [Povalibacter uvarum]